MTLSQSVILALSSKTKICRVTSCPSLPRNVPGVWGFPRHRTSVVNSGKFQTNQDKLATLLGFPRSLTVSTH